MRRVSGADLDWTETEEGESRFRRKQLGEATDGDDPVRYLVVSTMTEPDVTLYPDSGTFGVYVGSPPGGREERSLSGYYDVDETVDYWSE